MNFPVVSTVYKCLPQNLETKPHLSMKYIYIYPFLGILRSLDNVVLSPSTSLHQPEQEQNAEE